MTSTNGSLVSAQAAGARPADGAVATASRLALRGADEARAAWDGAWWPRTRLLADELPGLLAALPGRFGPITRVSYSLVFWHDAPRRLVFDGRQVRLGGFRTANPYSLSLIRAAGADAVDLLVVAPEADLALAARGLDAVAGGSGSLGWSAGATGAVSTAPVAPAAEPAHLVGAAVLPERAWENEGGSTVPDPPRRGSRRR